jgi:hypothetical protein
MSIKVPNFISVSVLLKKISQKCTVFRRPTKVNGWIPHFRREADVQRTASLCQDQFQYDECSKAALTILRTPLDRPFIFPDHSFLKIRDEGSDWTDSNWPNRTTSRGTPGTAWDSLRRVEASCCADVQSCGCPFRRSACAESIDQKRVSWVSPGLVDHIFWITEFGRPFENYHPFWIGENSDALPETFATIAPNQRTLDAHVADLRNGKDRAPKSKGHLGLWACLWVNRFQWVCLSSTALTVTWMTEPDVI